MSFIGDLERFFVDVIWPVRVPLAIALVAGMVVLVIVAWRRGWLAVARAHPRPVVVAVVLVVAIFGPIGWVLGSPLFLRSELVEETPLAAAGEAGTVSTLAVGEWQGADDFHFASGGARLVETADGLVLTLEDVSIQNGPDLFVYVSPDPAGWTEDAVNLGELRATDGTFSYDVPPGVDPADIASAVVWCRAFSVLFATATLGSEATAA